MWNGVGWNSLIIKIKEGRYHSVFVVSTYVSKPTVIPNHYNVTLMLGTVIYIYIYMLSHAYIYICSVTYIYIYIYA
jgi:hypothetical protein